MNKDADFHHLVRTLQDGGVAVIRTDTLYGLIAIARHEGAVKKVYDVKHRSPEKQCITLIAQPEDVPVHANVIRHYSQDEVMPTSVIVPATDEPAWILRGGKDSAYRVVRDPLLRRVIRAVGPVIAPSANPEGKPTAQTIDEAVAYFGDQVDMYIDGGRVPAAVKASRIVKVDRLGSVTTIRQ